jgi:hypothetical protein
MSNQHLSREKLQRLFDTLSAGPLQDEEEAYEVLREAELDPDVIAEEGLAFVSRLQARAELRLAAQERAKAERQLAIMKDRLATRLKEAPRDAKELLAGLLSQQSGASFQVHFRKIEHLDEEDVIDMLSEAQLLKLWEELEGRTEGDDSDDEAAD